MKMKSKRRCLASLMAFVMLAGALPVTAFAEGQAQAELRFQLGVSKVAFGGREWYVIGSGNAIENVVGDETQGVYPQEGHITLLAAKDESVTAPFRSMQTSETEGYTEFDGFYYANNPDGSSWTWPIEYAGSTLQQKMVDLANEIPEKERELITARTLTGTEDSDSLISDDGIAGPSVENQKLWALSADEYMTFAYDVMNGGNLQNHQALLRSPNTEGGEMALLGQNACNDGWPVDAETTVQPALSLDLSSVLFEFIADGNDKTAATVGGPLIAATDIPHVEMVKFTVKDSSQKLTVSATTEQSTQSGETLSFSYSGATTGENQYVSCILIDDEDGAVKYYGKLADSSSAASGTLEIPLAGISRGNYTLEIFSEKVNGELYTDFCSEPVTMKAYVYGNGSGEVSDFGGTIISDDATTYHVWFDGTIGVQELLKNSKDTNTYHPGMSAYYEGATDTCVEVTNGKVTLPETAGKTTKYGYTLNGWYDVYNETYYGKDMLGQEIEVTKDTVFYADWKASDYSLGNSEREKVTDQPNTSGFIETNVFDYNELFNIRSTTNDSADSRTYVNADTHAELWRLNTSSLGFAFLNWAYNDLTKDRTLGSIANKDKKNSALSNITQKIISGSDGTVTDQGQAILDALFTKSDELGRYYLGEGDGLYQYVSDASDQNYGYYYYDSSKNGVSYNQSEERFVLYSDPEYILEQSLKSNSWQYKADKAKTTGFLPFNDNESGEYNEKDGSINYWFGMQSTVDFWLPNDPGTTIDGAYGNISDTGKSMEFRFSGDDDVWVFVDDTLVLDLGGIHGARSGSINFSTGEVVTQTGKNQTTDEAITETTPLAESIKSGDHKLTIYYLERGSSQSNCSIYFNIAPKYALTILKKDADDDSALKGASFGIYSDKECTKQVELFSNADESESANVFVTDAYGMATCYGMAAGNTYYIKEIEPPDGYHITDSEPIRITWDNDGKPKVDEGVVLEQNIADKRYYLTVTNEKNPGSLTISKTVAGTGTPATDTAFGFTVTKSGAPAVGKYSVDSGEAQAIPTDGKISIKAGQSALLTELKPGEYTVKETTPEQPNYKSTTFSVNDGTVQSGYSATVTVSSDNAVSVAFINRYGEDDTPTPTPPTPSKGTGSLTVFKTVAGNAGSQTEDFHFTVRLSDASVSGSYGNMTFTDGVAEFTLKHGEQKNASSLPAGVQYTVTETEADQNGYSTTATGASGTIEKDATKSVSFINTKNSNDDSHDDLGNLIVSKVVAGNAGDTNKAFSFTVKLVNSNISGSYGDMTFANGTATFTLKHNEKKTATGLPAGISYEVTESEANQNGYTTTSTGANGSIVKDQTSTAAFTNTKNSSGGGGGGSKHSYGNLTVSKTVTGNAGETDRKFTFIVKLDRSLAGKYGDMTFNKGVAVITLKHGESSTATDLPAGVAYTVTESDNDGYTVTVVGDSGVISDGKTVVAAFTNNKDTTPDTPNAPDNPNVPNTPDTPNAPDNPDTPNTPDKPAVPTDSVPQTGDESNVGFWLALMIISFAAFTGVCIYGRKRRYTGRHVQK